MSAGPGEGHRAVLGTAGGACRDPFPQGPRRPTVGLVAPGGGTGPARPGRVRQWRHAARRRLYRGGRAGPFAAALNRLSAVQFAAGVLSPSQAMTMEVRGRRTGRVISFPVAVADLDGERYVVSMLGEGVSWVHNLRADNRAVLRRRGSELVRLEEVPTDRRAPVLRRYLAIAPGARAHVRVDRSAPLTEFARVAGDYPVFRVSHVRSLRR
ncbi:DUF385 domain-containing protein [Georgenia sp. 311]|nr:DUF385 domain-containing protein [Georgenia sp. 311]